ncbi:MAG TPA: PilC/PilY family type IV pilus protein [Woeseiaceae bacterium]|nr:PilC/PilY family type IV pilus protein [Woeseiaceae bacterium]
MSSPLKKYLAVGTSLFMTMMVSVPAYADDTELLLVDPSASAATPPNILFILDTSGSMGDPVPTTRPYDSTDRTYPGSCQEDRFYWTTLDVEPSCVGGTNTQWVDDSAFLCNDATLRMSGIGAYTGVLVQYSSSGGGSTRWQQLEIGNNSDEVECQNDSGTHGDGASDVFAHSAAGSGQWTADPDLELAWGSGDAAQVYTIYDGNYLNWKENPVTVNMPKMDILKAVTRNLLNAIEDVNVGIMRFNDSEGGRVIHDISDLNADRAAIIAEIQGLVAGGRTPLAESLYEAALYWRGMGANYGNFSVNAGVQSPADIDAGAFVGGVPGTYEQPAIPVCTRNFNVLLTDGMPVSDSGAQALAPLLPGFSAALGGATTCDGAGDGRCLDDIGEYLFETDLDTASPNSVESVITHTIGFAINLPILVETATASGGEYSRADDVGQLMTALMRIVEIALDKGLSFSAPAVAVNTFNRTQNLNDLYISTFLPEARVHWPGNLKKYTIDGGVIKDSRNPPQPAVDSTTGFFGDLTQSYWSAGADGADVLKGGAANVLPDPTSRRVFTNHGFSKDLTIGTNTISQSNTALTLADFGLTGAANEPTLDEVIQWTLGEDVMDIDDDATTTVRNQMGDPLHSQPAAVVYGTAASPEVVVFSATNDGYLHAVDGDTGVELWSFIPKQLLADLPDLMLDGVSTYKHYGIDGDIVPVIADLNDNGVIDGSDFVHVIFGMRRGGNTLFSLDVTNKNNPRLNWVKSYPEWGETWARPVVSRIDMNSNAFDTANTTLKAVVVVAEGYDTVHDTAALPATPDNQGAGISILDLFSGDRLWRAGRSNADLTLPAMTRSFPSAVRVIDFTGDGFADRMYAIDVGGQLFRFDIFRNRTPANTVTGGVIARFGGEGVAAAGATDTRRFYTAPDVSIFTDPVLNRRFLAVGVGSGYRAHPLDTSAPDAYFSLRDADVFNKLDANAYTSYPVALEASMKEVSGQVNTVIGASDRGWKFTVPAGQMILSASATFDNSVFFISFSPEINTQTPCQVVPGKNFLYRVNVSNGDPIANNLDTMAPGDSDAARVTALQQGGIAPTPAFLFPAPDSSCTDDCAQPPIGCVGVECFDPDFRNNPVRTLWTQDGIE